MLPVRVLSLLRAGAEKEICVDKLRKKNEGMMTLEASIIIPVILFLFAGVLLLFLAQGKRESLRGEMYTSLYTIPYAEEKKILAAYAVMQRANDLSESSGVTSVSYTGDGDRLVLSGGVRFAGIGKYGGTLSLSAGRERDKCVSRLRRWQFYGNITEDEGD